MLQDSVERLVEMLRRVPHPAGFFEASTGARGGTKKSVINICAERSSLGIRRELLELWYGQVIPVWRVGKRYYHSLGCGPFFEIPPRQIWRSITRYDVDDVERRVVWCGLRYCY